MTQFECLSRTRPLLAILFSWEAFLAIARTKSLLIARLRVALRNRCEYCSLSKHLMQASAVEAVLDRPDFTLEDLLEEDELIQVSLRTTLICHRQCSLVAPTPEPVLCGDDGNMADRKCLRQELVQC